MPRNNNQVNRRLGQVDNMVCNTQDERQSRINRLLRRTTDEEVIEPRNRQERREQGIRQSININNRVRDFTAENLWGRFDQEYSMQFAVPSTTACRGRTNNIYCHDAFSDFAEGSSISGLRYTPSTSKYIKHYDYIPDKFNFQHTESDYNEKCNNLYMGIELEIDNGGESDDTAKFIQEYLGEDNCYIMHDGSLTKGLEITTHPCSLNYHKSLPYQDLFKQLIDKGYKSHDTQTCGMHVHVNRNFFGQDPTIQDLCITKVLYLLEKYWDNIKVIARRDSSRYAKRFYMKEDESMFNLLSKAKGSGYGDAKYQIVNLLHKNTIEFRLFKGTLKYETFIATLEFVRNLVYLCKNKPLEQIQMTTFEEIIYALDNEYLVKYIKERGILVLENIILK